MEEEHDSEEESSSKSNQQSRQKEKQQPNPADEDLDDTPAAAEVDMIDTLTGSPVTEDELLFAIPVVAPYQTLQHYK